MSLNQLIAVSLLVAQSSLDSTQVLILIALLLVLFMMAVGWRVLGAVLSRNNRPPRRRR